MLVTDVTLWGLRLDPLISDSKPGTSLCDATSKGASELTANGRRVRNASKIIVVNTCSKRFLG